ncbi:hypothetical protein BN1356_02191 [Streptococcus varani]|uniref:Uncharacterized protein n=1 Tax=Streptococcus varani TaxID=1608583 RepID=A0A0E4CTK2_9STRE|nr:hypothetical protein [Streptococcus varani]CQR25844.1 hypothetical protein BN1356_02191 [Streptococcus varani]
MIENFATLEDIFADSLFDGLVESIRPKEVKKLDPDIERFQEIIEWIEQNGEEPRQSRVMKERKLYSRLKGLRANSETWDKYRAYDKFNLLGGVSHE